MALAPVAVLAVLAAAGERSWATCHLAAPQPFGAHLTDALVAMAHPVMLLVLLPFAALAAVFLFRLPRRPVVLVWLALMAAMLWMLLPPTSLHDCDRKGTGTFAVLMILPILGWPALLVALFLTRPAGKPS